MKSTISWRSIAGCLLLIEVLGSAPIFAQSSVRDSEYAKASAKRFNEDLSILPAELQRVINETKSKCESAGRQINFLPLFVSPVDLNNDQEVDFIVDLGGACIPDNLASCDGAMQCDLQVWMNGGGAEGVRNRYFLALSDRMMSHKIYERDGSTYFEALYVPPQCRFDYSETSRVCNAIYRGTAEGLERAN